MARPGEQQDGSGSSTRRHTVAALVVLGWVVVIVLVRVIHDLCSRLRWRERNPSADHDAPSSVRQPRIQAAAAAAATAVVVMDVELKKAAQVVVCAYRRADGWREATCPVCLSDFADGEAVSVLPACLHYFHDACVREWLRARATCPLCRAAPAGGAAKA